MIITWSGFFKPYTEQEVKANVPEKAGIYLLWVQHQNDKWRCFYAGQANNIRKRLLEHLSKNEPNECIKDKVSKFICGFEFAEVPMKSNRDGIEKYLIDNYDLLAECNEMELDCKSLTVNLP